MNESSFMRRVSPEHTTRRRSLRERSCDRGINRVRPACQHRRPPPMLRGLVLDARRTIGIGQSTGHDQESREGWDDTLPHPRVSFHVAGRTAVGRGRQAAFSILTSTLPATLHGCPRGSGLTVAPQNVPGKKIRRGSGAPMAPPIRHIAARRYCRWVGLCRDEPHWVKEEGLTA